MRYIYGSVSDTSSVGMGSYNFVTQKMICSMDYIVSEIHEIILSNRTLFNLNGVDMSQKFNHCTVIIYHAGKDIQDKSVLGMNSDCIYYVMDGRYTDHSNSQVENTHVVICSLGDSRVLNWKKGEFINYIRDAMFGLMILNYVAPFLLILIMLLSLIH